MGTPVASPSIINYAHPDSPPLHSLTPSTHTPSQAIDWAASRKHAHVVRLLEARTCPFISDIATTRKGWLLGGDKWENEWVVVHRARPWDNPAVSRGSVTVSVYPNKAACAPRLRLTKPELRPISADENDGEREKLREVIMLSRMLCSRVTAWHKEPRSA